MLDVLRFGHTNKASLVAAYTLLFETAVIRLENELKRINFILPPPECYTFDHYNQQKNQREKRLKGIREEQQQWLVRLQSGNITVQNPLKKHCSSCFRSFQDCARVVITREFASEGLEWGYTRVVELLHFDHRRICRNCFKSEYLWELAKDALILAQTTPTSQIYTLYLQDHPYEGKQIKQINFTTQELQPYYRKPLYVEMDYVDTVCFWTLYIHYIINIDTSMKFL